jgi:hypothetical protein
MNSIKAVSKNAQLLKINLKLNAHELPPVLRSCERLPEDIWSRAHSLFFCVVHRRFHDFLMRAHGMAMMQRAAVAHAAINYTHSCTL